MTLSEQTIPLTICAFALFVFVTLGATLGVDANAASATGYGIDDVSTVTVAASN